MKAVLVIDMSENCGKCRLADFGRCLGSNSYIHMPTKGRPKECPLRPLPQYMEEAVPYQVSETEVDCYQDPYAAGWNDCLKEITGEMK